MGILQLVRLGVRSSRASVILSGSLLGVSACGGLEGGDSGASTDDVASAETGSSTDTEAVEPIPARGISIVEVELNQGTRVPIGVSGQWVDEGARSGLAIASRDAVIRVHYSVDPEWTPREIEARLSLIDPNGASESFVDVRMVAASSARADLDGPFLFRLATDLEQTLAGTQYHVELWDRQPSLGEGMQLRDWANPAEGPKPIGFAPVPLQLKLVIVPIDYGGETLSLDDDVVLSIINDLYEQNPTTQILWDVHPNVAYAGQLNSLSSLLPVMAQLRSDEDADPNVYYHALVDVGSQSLGGVHGISYAANDTKADAGSRVSATVVWSIDPTIAVATFTHEVGHAQGLGHVQCPSTAAEEIDASFPHADGRIGEWGFGVRRMQVYDPQQVYDYMSYCGPTWVSDWGWAKTLARIETLTAWDFEGRASEPATQLLVGAADLDAQGEPSWAWWTMPGGVDPGRQSGAERVEFKSSDGRRVVADADVSTLSDQRTRWIKVELPADLGELTSIRYLGSDAEIVIDPALLVREARDGAWRPSF